ncbi:hypothetical protein V1514DRAFT_351173 [Lipomyces japonicus]|uniref:uncharacterized protein n=1 Tax=Lipomyces japonicus TaxID=56871 RepID=UPI0034CE8159
MVDATQSKPIGGFPPRPTRRTLNMQRIQYKRPWYSTAADLLHRATVFTLMGGTIYYTGYVCHMLWLNHSYRMKGLQEQKEEEAKRLAQIESFETAEVPK